MMDPLPPDEELDRFHQLLTGALDNVLSADEVIEFEQMLAASPERRAEWEEFRKLKETTMKMKFIQLPEEDWNRYWTGVYNRLERGAGWVLVSAGAIVLLCYGGFHFLQALWADTDLPVVLKAALLALLGGGVILFVSVVREKFSVGKKDKYKEIQR